MVYIDANDLRWMPYVKTWMANVGAKFTDETREYLMNLFNRYVDTGLTFINKKSTQAMKQVRLSPDYLRWVLTHMTVNTPPG